MNSKLYEVLSDIFDERLLRATLSGKRNAQVEIDKLKIRPVKIKGELLFQRTYSDGKREFHKNYEREELLRELCEQSFGEYKQLNAETTEANVQVLVNRKGIPAVRKTKLMTKREPAVREHNRRKKYLLPVDEPVPFLVDLGVMTKDGKIVNSRYDKFRQINRFLEFIEDILPELPRGRELTLIDFGCGKSYLTFAMYYYLKEVKGFDIRIIGLDLKEDVIEHCSALAKKYHYDKLEFLNGDIASYEGVNEVDMVVTLHACDTATDYALQKAVLWGARVILSVPCCQHELNGQISSGLMQPLLKYGLIKERMAALLTDAFRADLLEEQGYRTQLLEFIDLEHTPKNILIRAVKKPSAKTSQKQQKELRDCMDAWSASPLLEKLLQDRKEAEKTAVSERE
ncbi:MAG: SAM-dependent methyltransferase [Eubacteriales bacterium]|nr:SAM-dependent methyltransferase [Eubacteriales bacterium]